MNKTEREELRRLCNRATSGPYVMPAEGTIENNLRFLAASHRALPALLDALDEWESLAGELGELIESHVCDPVASASKKDGHCYECEALAKLAAMKGAE